MILDDIAARTRERVADQKKEKPISQMRKEAEAAIKRGAVPSFYRALQQEGISFICEVKKASPSKGVIAEAFPYLEIAKEYEAAGASAISVLTEPFFFQGSGDYLRKIAGAVKIPLLRKDFILDPWQIYEARVLGASAILLIAALLDKAQIGEYLELAETLGMDALVEAHTEEEVDAALAARAKLVGVNNRDLKTFQVDISRSIKLRSLVPDNILFVAESGIKTAEDIRTLRENRVDAVLIGETFMRSPDKKKALQILRGEKV